MFQTEVRSDRRSTSLSLLLPVSFFVFVFTAIVLRKVNSNLCFVCHFTSSGKMNLQIIRLATTGRFSLNWVRMFSCRNRNPACLNFFIFFSENSFKDASARQSAGEELESTNVLQMHVKSPPITAKLLLSCYSLFYFE